MRLVKIAGQREAGARHDDGVLLGGNRLLQHRNEVGHENLPILCDVCHLQWAAEPNRNDSGEPWPGRVLRDR
jgi:hypothetical protein